ncbi:hypothetical protein J6I39_02755 [bacterium]|nr:hypothetical protein [bacterium]
MLTLYEIDMNFKLYSFDIFDTLVTRRMASPSGIFILMQEIIKNNYNFSEFLRHNFYEIRKEAEALVRRKHFELYNTREITFEDIYENIATNYNLDKNQIDFLKNLEIDTEIKNLVLMPNFDQLLDYIQKNKNIILISDMYYSSSQLRYILVHLHPIFSKIKIYSSGEFATSKATGGLYSKIKELEGVDYKDWIHFGDNIHSDIKVAEKMGITTERVKPQKLNSYQNFLLRSEYSYISELVIGSSKLACLDSNNEKFVFGATIGGPLLYNYVDWILSQSIERKFKNLYFVARDGYILKLIADEIIKNKNLNIKTKYIYGSRKAWRVPTESSYEYLIKRIFKEYDYRITFNLIAYRLNVPIDNLLNLCGYKYPDRKLNHKERLYFTEKFLKDEKIKEFILGENESRYELLRKYLTQEIDFNKDIVFVDMHGSGWTQHVLSDLISKFNPTVIHTFYFTNYSMERKDNSLLYSYILSERYQDLIIELFSKSFDGQTIGYKEENNKIIPILECQNGSMMRKWGLADYINGVLAYTNAIMKTEKINDVSVNIQDIYFCFINYYRAGLDYRTASILASIPYSRIGNENAVKYCAKKIHTLKLLVSFLLCQKPKLELDGFPHISYVLSSKHSKKLQNFLCKYSTLQKFLFNIYYSRNQKSFKATIFGHNIDFSKLLWRIK